MSGPLLLHKKPRPRSSSFSTPSPSLSSLSSALTPSNASIGGSTRSGSALGFRRERTGTSGVSGLAGLVAQEIVTGGGAGGLGVGVGQGSREAFIREGPWAEVARAVTPLFNGEGLKTNVEDLNEQVSLHIRRLMTTTPARTLPQVLTLLSADVFHLICQNCSKILQPKLFFPDTPEGNDRLLQRLTEVWSFYWTSVLPYLEGIFLPCRTDDRIQRALARLVQQSQSVTNQQSAQTAAIELEKANATMPDVRKLALTAFRDYLISPIITRLTKLLTILYDSKEGEFLKKENNEIGKEKKKEEKENSQEGAPTRKMPRSASVSASLPTQSSGNSTPSSSAKGPTAGSETQAAQAAHAKRLQMISILCSVMTDDEAQENMGALLNCMRRWNKGTGESSSRKNSMMNGQMGNKGSDGFGKGRGESWENRGGFYTAKLASRRGEWKWRRRAGRKTKEEEGEEEEKKDEITQSPKIIGESLDQDSTTPSPVISKSQGESGKQAQDGTSGKKEGEEEEEKDAVPEVAPIKKGRERSGTMSRRWRSDSTTQRMSYFAELAGPGNTNPPQTPYETMMPKDFETPLHVSRRLANSPRLQATDQSSIKASTKGSGASTPTLGNKVPSLDGLNFQQALQMNPNVNVNGNVDGREKVESLKELRRRGVTGIPMSIEGPESMKKERRNGFVEA